MSTANSRENFDLSVWEYAIAGDFTEVKNLVSKGGSVHMAIMAVGKVKEDYDDDNKNKPLVKDHNEIFNWALANGSCLLWSFSQKRHYSKFTKMSYNKPITMLKGPGEVPRGTFNKSSD